LKSIDDRLEQGIFDPDADLRDIQNYLLYTMGRDARQTVDYTRRLVRADNQLATWWDEKRKLEKDVSTISDALKANRALLKKENELPPEDPRDIQHLNDAILEQEKQIADLQARIKDLTEKINQRVKDYGLRLEDMENFAHQIDATNEMWRELQKTKGEMQQTLDGLITGDVAPAPPQ
jgi:chromosome segregation ATPase